MRNRDRLLLALFAISAIGYFPLSQWITTTQVGTSLLLLGQMIYALATLAAVLGIPVLLVRLLVHDDRRQTAFLLVVAIVFIPCCFWGARLGRKVRMAGMESFAGRSQPLIAAIESYERDHSAPPGSLDDLVPEYLPAIPSTGMMAYPEYRYHFGSDCPPEYGGNLWALSVFTPNGGINFDRVLYFPNQNYPARGFGGWLERIGDWAYVHE